MYFSLSPNIEKIIGNSVLSLFLLLFVSDPYLGGNGGVYLSFIAISGALLIVSGRQHIYTVLIFIMFVSYALLIALTTAGESLRLGVVAAASLGYLLTRFQGYYISYAVAILIVFAILMSVTDGLTSPVRLDLGVSQTSSINYFSQAIFYIIVTAVITSQTKQYTTLLAFLVFMLTTVTIIFVPSRQLLITATYTLVYLIYRSNKIRLVVSIMAISASFVYFAQPIDILEQFSTMDKFMNRGLETGREGIFSCYISNISVSDLLIGSDNTTSGGCALKLIGVKYLHNGFLETVSQLGFLGILLITANLLYTAHLCIRKEWDLAITLIFISIYQLVEGGFMWVNYFVIFRILYKSTHALKTTTYWTDRITEATSKLH